MKKTAGKFVDQGKELLGKLSPSQRYTLIAVPVLLLAAFAYLSFRGGTSGYSALLNKKRFAQTDIAQVEQVLLDKGFDVKTQGQQILVPSKDLKAAENAAIASGFARDWSSSLGGQKQNSLFTTADDRQRMNDELIARRIRSVLQDQPAIADAHVLWSRPAKRSRWSTEKKRIKAVVSVTPKPGRHLAASDIATARAVVSDSINMSPSDVTVVDAGTGIRHQLGDESSLQDGKILSLIKQHTNAYRERIGHLLSYIGDVIVTVHVDVDNFKEHIEHSQQVNSKETAPLSKRSDTTSRTISEQGNRGEPGQNSNRPGPRRGTNGATKTEKNETSHDAQVNAPSFKVVKRELLPGMPKTVQVAIAVPDEHYKKVAIARGFPEGDSDAEKKAFVAEVAKIRTEIEQDLQGQVAQLLPAGSPPTAVSVKSYTPVPKEEVVAASGFVSTAGKALSEWGSAIALGVLALIGLWMLHRTMPRTTASAGDSAPEPAPGIVQKTSADDVAPGEEETETTELSARERIRQMSRDNPEMTAAVLTKWIDPE